MSLKLKGDNFASLLTPRPRFYTDPGSQEQEIYELTIDKKGHKTLEVTGTKNVFEEIQSYADECDIKQIVARAAAGDVEILNQRQGVYLDITEMPANLAEAQNQIIKLKNDFNQLPNEIREKFDNSAEKFINDFGTKEWAEAMGYENYKTTENEKVQKVDFVPGTTAANNEILTPEA